MQRYAHTAQKGAALPSTLPFATLGRLKSTAVLVTLIALAACGGGSGGGSAPLVGSPPPSHVNPILPQANAVYLGAWARPDNAPPGATPAQNIAALEASIGRKFALSLHYDDLRVPFPTADEQADLANHRVPVVSLGCNDTDFNIANGSQDALLIAKAAGIRAVGTPVFLRYKWEFNLLDTTNGRTKCADPARDTNGYFSSTAFVAAYRHIHDLMIAQGATNIAWIWNPSSLGVSGIPYWPGDSYVDWVGIDDYDRQSSGTSIFVNPYALYALVGNGSHPVIIAETGAVGSDQPRYFNEAVPALETQYPKIKAFVYFDASGPADDYSLTPAGLQAFRQFAAIPYLGATVP